jgi:alginate O-acetyltransferase complex protein AlgI
MNAYLPIHLATLLGVVLLIATATLGGFAWSRVRSLGAARAFAWVTVVALLLSTERLVAGERAGFRMLALISVGLVAMKGPVSVEATAAGTPRLPFGRWLCFALGWFGMDPLRFATRSSRRPTGARELLGQGASRLVLGAALIVAAREAWERTDSRALATAIVLPGISLVLHFGVLTLSAAAWRALGFDVRPLFRAPLLAESLGEFWARRWNLAFSEMTAAAVYRPLARTAGKPVATLAAFAFSGLLHEMAISLPVRAGFGLPMVYFLLQGLLVLAERELARRGRAPSGWVHRALTLGAVAAGLPILFHPRFLEGVVWPLLSPSHAMR